MSVLGLSNGVWRGGKEGASLQMRGGWWDVQVERGRRQGKTDSEAGQRRDRRMETS